MGENYYLHFEHCPHCGRSDDPLHIGKSSGGWCFSLHVIPEMGLTSLEAWGRMLDVGTIRDEYNKMLTKDELLKKITGRGDGLRRHTIDGVFCVGHGPGTWDLIAGDFS